MKIKCRGNLVSLLSDDNDYEYYDSILINKVSLKGDRYAKLARQELRHTTEAVD